MDKLKNKIILVMGGTSGIGLEAVKQIPSEGAFVIFTGRRDTLGFEIEQEINTEHKKVKFIKCDATIENDVKHVINYIENNHKKLDGSINSQIYSDMNFSQTH